MAGQDRMTIEEVVRQGVMSMRRDPRVGEGGGARVDGTTG